MKRLIFIISFTVLLLVGCSRGRIVPVTDAIIAQIGLENAHNYQYYISTGIVLNRSETQTDVMNEAGQVVRLNQTTRNIVNIGSKLPGVLISKSRTLDGRNVFDISFESDNERLSFGRFMRDQNPNYKLFSLTPTYGGAKYNVSWKDEERPYLLIALKDINKIKENTRNAKGRKL
jgi:hypothetical protein